MLLASSLAVGLLSVASPGALSTLTDFNASCEVVLTETNAAKLKGQRAYFMSPAVVEAALERVNGQKPSLAQTRATLQRIRISDDEQPGRFSLTYSARSPEFALKYVHAHIVSFREQMFEHRTQLLSSRLDRLSKRLEKLNDQKDQIEDAYWKRVPFHDLPSGIKQTILARLNAADVDAEIIHEILTTVTWPPRFRKERLDLIIATRLNREEIETSWRDYIGVMRELGAERRRARLAMKIVELPELGLWSKARSKFFFRLK